MELEDSEDLDEVPTNRPVPERFTPEVPVDQQLERSVAPHVAETQPREAAEAGAESPESPASGESRDNRGGMRGRRRRRGRRGERMPEFTLPSPVTETPTGNSSSPERTERTERNRTA